MAITFWNPRTLMVFPPVPGTYLTVLVIHDRVHTFNSYGVCFLLGVSFLLLTAMMEHSLCVVYSGLFSLMYDYDTSAVDAVMMILG